MKKTKLTIAIPAFNEEKNIKNLLDKLLSQNFENIVLDKIIVVSDDSTDNTTRIVRSIKNPVIVLIENKKRMGKPASQNIIFKNSSSDILIILDADIIPDTNNFIKNITKPFFSQNNIGITGADTIPALPKTFIQKVINDSHLFKTNIYKKINNGDSIYLCHGRARAFSKAFYSKLIIPADCTQEDAYSYLLCKKNGFKFKFVPDAKVIFNSPATVSDHAMQSLRFSLGNKCLSETFDDELIKNEYHIPAYLLITVFIQFLLKSPLSAISYVLIQLYISTLRHAFKNNKGAWNVSSSTKNLLPYEKI